MERSPIADRIERLIELKEVSIKEIAELLGVQRSSLSHILSGRNKPSLDFILKLLSLYPDINEKWLLHGKDAPFKAPDNKMTGISSIQEEAAESIESPVTLVTSSIDTSVTNENAENITEVKSSHPRPKDHNKDLITSRLASANREIQQVMILYKDGSFEVYSPRANQEE